MSAIFGTCGDFLPTELHAMGARLVHLGPKGDLAGVTKNVQLGTRGVGVASAIVRSDPVALAADALVFNGADLRNEADVEGDAAILARLYATRGVDGLNLAEADYAVALWDDRAAELVLARDYLGARPLFYAAVPGRGLVFASEYKALLTLADLPAEADRAAVQYMQHCKHLPVGWTMLKAVRSVPPGAQLVFDRDGRLKRQTALPVIPLEVQPWTGAQARDAVARSFVAAVRSRSQAAPRVGISLSGGIDSMGLACTCRSVNPDREIHTFTGGAGPDDPEMMAAEIVAQHIGSVHHSIVLRPETVVERLPELVWHLEDPIARSESLLQYEVARAAASHTDLLLTGNASDGLFAGMPKHKILWFIKSLPPLREPLRQFYHLTQTGVWPQNPLGRIMSALYFGDRLPPVPDVPGGAGGRPDATSLPSNGPEFINAFLQPAFQPGISRWIAKVERMIAAHGVAHTSPFFDRNLIRTAFQVPDRYKIYRGKEKYVLRAALRTLVPPEVLNIPKFPTRMRYDAAFADALDALQDRWLTRERVERHGFFDVSQLRALRRRPAGKAYPDEWGMRIWTAVATEIWAEWFLDKRGAP